MPDREAPLSHYDDSPFPVAPPQGAPLPADSADGPAPLSVSRIQQYVWKRYVEFEPAPFPLDEDEALKLLDEHYAQHDLESDTECFYYGILAYELAFARPEHQSALLRKALKAFLAYLRQTDHFKWSPVQDRYDDAVEQLRAEADPGE